MAKDLGHETTLFAEPILPVGGFTITNSLLTGWIAVIVLVVIALVLRKKISVVPKKFQTLFEIIIEQGLQVADLVTNNRKLSLKVFPIAITIFFFVLITNWLGFFPGVGSIGFIQEHNGHDVLVPLLRGGTADINTTLALGLVSVIGANIFGIIIIGFWKLLNKYINIQGIIDIPKKIKSDPVIIITAPIHFLVGLFEVIGEFAKVASLSFRLFGNIFAGEVLLMSMSLMVAFLVPIPFLFLEIFVGTIQALIFALLTVVYFTVASMDHDDHHEESHKTETVSVSH